MAKKTADAPKKFDPASFLPTLKANWDLAIREYQKIWRRMETLDSTDRGKLWQAIRAKYPDYQILPETNHVSYVKNHLLAALYSIGRQADLQMRSEEDKNIVQSLNIALEKLWQRADVAYYQMLAGERAALLNLGVTWVAWDADKKGGTKDSFYCGVPKLVNVSPMKYMRDPYADDQDNASFAIIFDTFHESVLKSNPLYKDTIATALAAVSQEPAPVAANTDRITTAVSTRPQYHRVEYHWIRTETGAVHEFHTLNNTYILHYTEDLKPSMFPIAELYCNLPAGDLVGTSEPAKIFANSLVYNTMQSIIATSTYKNQRPPKFVTNQAMLNLDAFRKHGNDSDHTFLVNGDASRAVHYQEFPVPGAEATYTINQLGMDIKTVSGVTDKYTGADTGSLLTTGGMEAMLEQATLIDQPKLNNYERYSRRLSELIIHNYLARGQKETYLYKDPRTNQIQKVVVDPSAIPKEIVFDYELNISPYLPKTRQRLAQMANVLMEKQMQYGGGQGGVNFITPEEWLMMQDLPIKEYMMERMNLERNADYIKKVAQVVYQYAELTANGMDPEDAIVATAGTMEQQMQPNLAQPNMDPMAIINQMG